jgi:ABC-2 type transport system permease protein
MTGPAPQAAAARPSAAVGNIYDLGYRNYDGPRLGRPHAIQALFIHTLKVAYGIGRGGRAKLAPFILLALATIPAVVAVGALALLRQAGAPEELADEASPIRHDTYYAIITTLVVLFCAAQVPETLGRDQRYQLLSLYFSRALRRADYALARFAGIAAAVLLFVLLPQAVIFFGLSLSAEDVAAEFGRELAFAPAILGQAMILAGLLGGLSAVVSAFTPRRAYATAAVIVFLAVTPIISTVLIELGTTTLATLLVVLSPADILDATNAWLFDRRPESGAVIFSDLPLEAFGLAAVLISAACLAILVWRYRGIAA